MAAPLDDALDEVVSQLREAGVPASGNPRGLRLPAVLVTPKTFAFDRLESSTYTGTWDLYLLARDTGRRNDALATLSELAAALRNAFAVVEFTAMTLTLPNVSGPDGTPALHATLTTTVHDDE